MGEARKKRETHEALLRRFPFCIFCGGQKPATSIEHMPPRMMFRAKQRPDGLVFPACDECNQGTSHSDLVASMLGRVYPDAADNADRADIQKTVQAVAKNVPGLLEEMHLDEAEQARARRRLGVELGGFLRLNGPLVTPHMAVFAAKMGPALYFDATDKTLPPTGGIVRFGFRTFNLWKGKYRLILSKLCLSPKPWSKGESLSETSSYIPKLSHRTGFGQDFSPPFDFLLPRLPQ